MRLKALAALAALIAAGAIATTSLVGNATQAPKTQTLSTIKVVSSTSKEIAPAPAVADMTSTEEVPATPPPAKKTKTLSVLGTDVGYENTSIDDAQAFIDQNSDSVGTYYGSSFNGTDGETTHFAGHDYGKFGVIKQLTPGAEVVVYDEAGTAFTYVVTDTRTITMDFVDGAGYTRTQSDNDFLMSALYTSGEALVLQTCASEVVDGTFDVAYVVAVLK